MSDKDNTPNGEDIQAYLGTVITVMGTPKKINPANAMQAVNDISEVALNYYENVEVAFMEQKPIITAGVVKANPGEYDGEHFATPIMRAAATVFAGAMVSQDELEEAEEEKRRASMSPEEIEEEEEAESRRIRDMIKEGERRSHHEIKEAVVNSFDIAEKWAHTPGLSVREVAHGVAHDLHALYAYDFGKSFDKDKPRNPKYPTPGQAYSKHYDQEFESKISDRSMRAAREMFGEGK